MSSKREVQISKALSLLLRHSAVKENIEIDQDGFVLLDTILNHNRIKTHKATLEEIKSIVENNDKKRFRIETRGDQLYICANQGHTIKEVGEGNLTQLVNLEDFPSVIIHGTYKKHLPLIMKTGLSRMGRNHIHFTFEETNESKVISGMRKGCNALIYLDIPKCIESGLQFYKSSNNVILCAGNDKGFISPDLFLKVVDRSGNVLEAE
ncbi:tRNA 2'-phosphotransferase [[Candida] anglica]|uniref:2'-phosphotransferase n=1 Tax=[Candida] anglica TaxID=148631 RepID=A0ABP0EI42_9ASCO